MKTNNYMKRGIITTVLMTVLSVSLIYAGDRIYRRQGNNANTVADRVEALRIAYISEQLNLTPAEAEHFWPVYNAYRKDLSTLQQNYHAPVGSQLTAEQQLDLEQKKLDLKKTYKPRFEAALGTEKLNQLYNLEHKFQEKLKEIREQRMQQRNLGPGVRPAPGR